MSIARWFKRFYISNIPLDNALAVSNMPAEIGFYLGRRNDSSSRYRIGFGRARVLAVLYTGRHFVRRRRCRVSRGASDREGTQTADGEVASATGRNGVDRGVGGETSAVVAVEHKQYYDSE